MNKAFIFLFMAFLFPVAIEAQTFKAWLSAGDEAFNKARYGEAIEYYAKAIEFETGDLTLMMKMADATRLSKDYERAATWYGKLILEDKETRFPLALFYYGEMKKYLGMYEESGRIFERYLKANPTDTGYTGVKAKQEVAEWKLSADLAAKKPGASITNAGSPVNTNYSEFGASMMGDTALYFSSLRFLFERTEKNADPYYVSRILKSSVKGKSTTPVPLPITLNESSTHNCNAAFSPDYRIMIFSRCASADDFTLDCKLMMSKLENGKWSKPVLLPPAINMEGFTSTQPAIEARGAEGYTLYFISDRPGGQGKLDLWRSDMSATAEFTAPENLGTAVNTYDDELTPFFYTPTQTLYFSSYGHTGMGGMDIFRSSKLQNGFSAPENMGTGYNSSYNDVYYTLNRDTTGGTFSSNRYGSMYLNNRTCCYDIYYFKIIPPEIVKDSVILATRDSVVKIDNVKTDDITLLSTPAHYDNFLPLQLYFENDEPDKRTTATETKRDYESLYQEYIGRIGEYKIKFAGTLTGEKRDSAEMQVEQFFDEKVTASRNLLNEFCTKLEKALALGIKIELEIRGRASPLAKDSYNINLSKRRISSLLNYMKKYNNGVLASYFDDRSLIITEVAAGESLAKSSISDELKDKRNSVYHPAAAAERRIELINIKLVQPGHEKK